MASVFDKHVRGQPVLHERDYLDLGGFFQQMTLDASKLGNKVLKFLLMRLCSGISEDGRSVFFHVSVDLSGLIH
jgi:hypothetical protein